ncbi:MAG: terminase large subunit domain-containing protein [Candidatus Zixiibacteriota bacterium]
MNAHNPSIDWQRGLHDPVYFAEQTMKLDLHPGQKRWLAYSTAPENMLVTGNRWGKSFVSAVKAIHHAVYRPRSLRFDRCGHYRIALASITLDQAKIVFDQVSRLLARSPLLESLIVERRQTPYPQIRFGNSARIEARSTQNRGEYLLGQDYDLFIFDEVAFETDPEYVVEEVIKMRLADREGKLDLVSTPNGKNWFYRRFRDIRSQKLPGYCQSGDSRNNPHISADYLSERVRLFSQARVQQNIMGQFVDSGGEILRSSYIDRALKLCASSGNKSGDNTPALINGWDLARKRTATVGITLSITEGIARIVALERFKRFDWCVVIEKIKQRQQQYPGRLVVDGTGLGDVIVEQLSEYSPQAVIFTEATKAELLANVELFHAQDKIAYDRWDLPDGPGRTWSLIDELREARWDDNNKCDALMALALALWPLRRRDRLYPAPRLGRV